MPCTTCSLHLELLTYMIYTLKGFYTLPNAVQTDHYKLYSVLCLNWPGLGCIMTVQGIEIELPKIIQVPKLKQKKLMQLLKDGHCRMQLLATDGLYIYHLGKPKPEVIEQPQVGPYAALISEVQEAQSTYPAHTGPTAPNIDQCPSSEVTPSTAI